ncbi:ABC transporter ATP-binding protein/permease [Candidatus Xianfuyuplasma coldseepsis]|uniref:ABC transporter ATP-binding protein/permease n=1 Tax=Candidatus Xianfuyuplasma coldseepsis TaxID=2782163 RepID=A0A7L7KQJ2_9MOLU|nr:ABC transporter ATP-binding protein/permease [Xianfuyuplasma coldseepsis]QMS84496.1 ABC transporter ATP-binding protein/permease [Xianfuyuplasma coldseepsis]
MIKLRKLDKYYNRNKSNEIHVLNDISLDLPSTGLVVLLGPSGSGKTTLLNVLGGLDKVQSGTIQFDETSIGHYSSSTWDKIRNREVGYIFQNYNLLNHLTVYENISLTLNMIGIYDKDEIDRRIDYILDHMGMINYRKRKASQLSGGQQQRVAIARALAKNPKVIIADEPTGNLDSKNTQDIMNIIKAISVNKLVVLVTHEENIAEFYGDRIIKLSDGQIVSDEDNRSSGTLDTRHEADIYLKDMEQITELTSDQSTLKVYTDEELSEPINVRLIVKNKTLYIDVDQTNVKKLQLVEKDSEVRIYDKKYEHTNKESLDIKEFDLESVIEQETSDIDKHSVISVKDSLRIAWNRMKDATRLGKVFYIGFGLIAGLIALAIGMGNSFISIDKDSYLNDSEYLIRVRREDFTYDDFIALTADDSIDYIRAVDSISINALLPKVFQLRDTESAFSNQIESVDKLSSRDVEAGRLPETTFEFVIDQQVADQLLASTNYKYVGIDSYEKLFELDYEATMMNLTYELTLVGIVDNQTPLMYMDDNLAYSLYYGVGIYEMYEDQITLETGDLPEGDELLVLDGSQVDPIGNLVIPVKQRDYEAVGTFSTTAADVPQILIRKQDLGVAYFDLYNDSYSSNVAVIANDVDNALSYLDSQGYTATSYANQMLADYQNQRISQGIGTITFIAIVLVASAVSYFFVIRSSLLARIYEVSVYRALGVSKLDVHKMFLTETVLITSLTSLFGYALTTWLLWRIQLAVDDFTEAIQVTPLSVIAGVLIIYLINIVSGLIPVGNLLRKTPAEILSKYDF